MGSSTRKKREKKQDFKKTKLKVGKTRPKNTNATDTSFTAKSIVVKEQSLAEQAPERIVQFQHRLSLLGSKSESQRKDALAYLTHTIAAGELPVPASSILAKAQPLVLDANSGVRQALLKMLQALPAEQLGRQELEQVILYTRAGMTHLAESIRRDAINILEWLLLTTPDAVVGGAGSWIKGLRTFQSLLGWHADAMQPNANGVMKVGNWTASNIKKNNNPSSSKLLVVQLNCLARFLTVGLAAPPSAPEKSAAIAADLFPLWHTDAHLLPTKTQPFAYLNLFGATRDVESESYETAEERSGIFTELGFKYAFEAGAKEAKKEAGEVGRAASAVEKALKLAGG